MGKVKDYPNLDKKDGSVINNSTDDYQKRLQIKRQQGRLKTLENDVDSIRVDIGDIKESLALILLKLQE